MSGENMRTELYIGQINSDKGDEDLGLHNGSTGKVDFNRIGNRSHRRWLIKVIYTRNLSNGPEKNTKQSKAKKNPKPPSINESKSCTNHHF